MKTIWYLVIKELKTQENKIYALVPLPLIFFYGMLQPLFNVGAYSIMFFLMAYFFLLANNHKQLDYKFDWIIHSLPINKHEILLSKYLMVIVWFIISVLICNVIGIVYMILNHLELRFSSLTEISFSLSVLFLVSGMYYPLYYLLYKKFLYINVFMIIVFTITAPSILQSVPEFIIHSPVLLLLTSVGVFIVSYWPSYLLFIRTKLV